eukprot:Gb_20146 [translate_table: standard]
MSLGTFCYTPLRVAPKFY